MRPTVFRKKRKYCKSKAGMLVNMVVTGGLLAFVGWLLLGEIEEAWRSFQAREWNEVPATVTGYHEKTGRFDSYALWCEYVYGNKVYETCSMGYGEDDKALYERGMKDGEVTAYVNPDDPEDAILSAGINQDGWIDLAFWTAVFASLGWALVREMRIFRRRFYDAEYKQQTALYLEGEEPRMCLWSRWESLDGVFLCLTEKIRKYVRIEEGSDPLNGVAVCSGKNGAFFLVTEKDIDHEDVVYSPDMTREDVERWFSDYEGGAPLVQLIEGWKKV